VTGTGRIGAVTALGAGVLLFIVAARPVRPRGGAAPRPAAGAQPFLDRLRAATGTPAVSGAVALGGKVVFSGGAGMIDLENHVAATGNSVYDIGSLSKAVTAIAVMQLVEKRRISLDDDVRSYVPELPDKGATITIRHLLTHTSGIRHYRPTDFPGTPDNENIQPIASWKDGLRFFAADPLLFPPGKFFYYSSYGVNLLQGVVEKAAGETFEAYLGEHVWKPAGMASASFDIPERIVPHRARSYRIDHGSVYNYYYNDLRYKFASGGMIASVEDLARLGAALNHGLLLHPATRATLLSPQIDGLLQFREGAAPAPVGFQQAMLWRLRRDGEGRQVAYECGSVKGFNACLVDFLDDDLVAAVAANSFACCGWPQADALAALFRRPSSPTAATGSR
jgi:CubicO group peptidase (beta-lactamase class C family)